MIASSPGDSTADPEVSRMAHANLVSVLALSITGATTLLVACSGGGDQGPSMPPTALGTGGIIGTGGTTTVATAPPAPTVTGGGSTTTNVVPPVPTSTGAGGTTQTVFPPPPSGGVPGLTTGTGIAGAPAGGATGVAGSTGAAGSTATAPGTPWDPNKALDAMGNLIPPAAGQGWQILTPTFDLQPGQEVFNCFHVAAPNDTVLPVGEWDSQMSPGSHHFILYRSPSDSQATAQGVLASPGCTQGFGGNSWLYTMGAPRGHLQMPDGVAMEIQPHEKIDFDMHYINTGSELIHAHIGLNANKVLAATYQKADAEISFNTGIYVPPMGTQTVQGTCPNVPGASYFLLQTHMHHHGTDATISRVSATGQSTELVHTTNWDSPEVKIWEQAPFLTLAQGEHFAYTCSYKNDTTSPVTVGTSASINEMCMMEAYFFPASGATPACQ
jgi:hypothetical protein